ncbi:MAG: NAD(P)-dependent oxidoreductase, partial [Bacteroidaceae bacterium]|nr:NAD(P)-dependent oxidoreductase [Bacteroidaceae bacterium]
EEMVSKHEINVPEGISIDKKFIDTYTIKESVYEPILPSDTPQPNTSYGESKVLSEKYLSESGINYTIFRPTGVYGPREKDYFLMAKSIKQHFDSAVGFKPQEITFIYVRDLVNAILSAIGKDVNGKTYNVSDGFVYNSRAFSDLLQREMGIKRVIHITFPLWFLKIVCNVSEAISHVTGKMSALNSDKYNILKQRNWQCDISPLQEDLGFTPEWNLERGVAEAVEWYKKEGWI